MPKPSRPEISREDALRAKAEHGGLAQAARALGMSLSALKRRLQRDAPAAPTEPSVTFPVHPDDDLPAAELVAHLARRAVKRLDAAASREWQTIRLGTADPVVIAFVGDPHLGDDGTHWPMLLADVELMKRPGVYAVNIGDTTNNWTGRLMRLYSQQETSRKTERKLARWFMHEAGIRWLVWLIGNHDEWEHGHEILRLMNTTGLVMEDWSARFQVEFANGFTVPIWASHNFKGHSQFNKLHGVMRAARERRGASIYVAGHLHEWAVACEELPDIGEVFWALRARGYKFLDKYALHNGFPSARHGATVAAVIDPRTDHPMKAVTCFGDLETAVRFKEAIS